MKLQILLLNLVILFCPTFILAQPEPGAKVRILIKAESKEVEDELHGYLATEIRSLKDVKEMTKEEWLIEGRDSSTRKPNYYYYMLSLFVAEIGINDNKLVDNSEIIELDSESRIQGRIQDSKLAGYAMSVSIAPSLHSFGQILFVFPPEDLRNIARRVVTLFYQVHREWRDAVKAAVEAVKKTKNEKQKIKPQKNKKQKTKN